jgi:hypothetical protein
VGKVPPPGDPVLWPAAKISDVPGTETFTIAAKSAPDSPIRMTPERVAIEIHVFISTLRKIRNSPKYKVSVCHLKSQGQKSYESLKK